MPRPILLVFALAASACRAPVEAPTELDDLARSPFQGFDDEWLELQRTLPEVAVRAAAALL
jgi:hypothetical protein